MTSEAKKKRERLNSVIRWFLYYLLLIAEYVFLTTFRFDIPLPLLPLTTALCISVFEDPFYSALTGCAAGLLIDSAEGTLIGMNGIIIMWCCLMSSLLFYFVLRKHIVNVVVMTLAAALIQTSFRYVFYYLIWGYEKGGTIYLHEFLPIIISTPVSAALLYPLIKLLSDRLGLINETYIEQKSEDIVRE